MGPLQCGAAYGDFDSLAFGSDLESMGTSAKSERLGIGLEALGGPGDADQVWQVGHYGEHYYVDVPNSEESAYQACDRNVQIDPEFQHHLQKESETRDIIRFLALPEIILARQRRRQQPLLDFTKSKILTSHTYTKTCERELAQKEATQVEVKRKAELREATKETRQKEKEEQQLQIRAWKQARTA